MSRRLLSLLPVVLLAACVQVAPVPLDDHDQGAASSGATGHGSAWVRPRRDWRADEPDARVPAPPKELDWEELPVARIGRIERYMTEAELLELLGPPMRDEVEVQGIDSEGNDWNATVYTWRYRDLRQGVAIERDLEVRLARLETRRPLPARPEIVGDGWVVLTWDLF